MNSGRDRIIVPPRRRLVTRAPFHLQATVRVLQRRPVNRVEVWDDDRYVRVLPVEKGHVLAAVTNRGSLDRPDLCFSFLAASPRALRRETAGRSRQVAERLGAILGLDVDPTPLRRAALSEPGLREAANALRGMRPPRFAGLFETFLNVIPFQQLSLDAGIAIIGRLVERFGPAVEYRGHLFYAPPDSSAIAGARPSALRACGLSARKADALRAIARAIASGTLDAGQIAGLPTDAALRRLVELPGIGPWSAALVLLRGFRRLDVFPPGDVGARRGLDALLHGKGTFDDRVRRFGELRGYLYFLGLGGSLLRMGLIDAAGKEPARFRR
ncbi:MAG TPA: AlkA N-terminal domain-containing protein [Woeseiaceae bacterium]|nr:AlkA N-terminal domain-containing protein [Woeseiaceae bacterium]